MNGLCLCCFGIVDYFDLKSFGFEVIGYEFGDVRFIVNYEDSFGLGSITQWYFTPTNEKYLVNFRCVSQML